MVACLSSAACEGTGPGKKTRIASVAAILTIESIEFAGFMILPEAFIRRLALAASWRRRTILLAACNLYRESRHFAGSAKIQRATEVAIRVFVRPPPAPRFRFSLVLPDLDCHPWLAPLGYLIPGIAFGC